MGRGLAKAGFSIVVIAGLLFAAAGRFDWPMAWVYVGLALTGAVIGTLVADRGLLAERAGIVAGSKDWDIPLAIFSGRLGPLAMAAVAGLDRRYGWTSGLPLAIVAAAGTVLALAYALTLWAMAVNRFFSAVVRIQHDRGHVVVDRGPYRLVRHPGYVGVILVSLATPVLLGSAWALAPAGLVAAIAVLRTALEDRTLGEELPGYRDYARRVPYRLLPGIW
ncbi:MAG: isoprenylcysteine carboxylmethyltransferase family protein [bacterium]|nr:isoprenylcysteine carboxylmethyltransferase family protein [bacterium]